MNHVTEAIRLLDAANANLAMPHVYGLLQQAHDEVQAAQAALLAAYPDERIRPDSRFLDAAIDRISSAQSASYRKRMRIEIDTARAHLKDALVVQQLPTLWWPRRYAQEAK